jgi:hypothetical protein
MQQFQRPGEEGRIEKNHMGGPKKRYPLVNIQKIMENNHY